ERALGPSWDLSLHSVPAPNPEEPGTDQGCTIRKRPSGNQSFSRRCHTRPPPPDTRWYWDRQTRRSTHAFALPSWAWDRACFWVAERGNHTIPRPAEAATPGKCLTFGKPPRVPRQHSRHRPGALSGRQDTRSAV